MIYATISDVQPLMSAEYKIMETINLILRYGFGIAVVLEGGWIVWALARLARDKARLDDMPDTKVEQ
jgi:hypothetical protein